MATNVKSTLLLSANNNSPQALRRRGLAVFDNGTGDLIAAGKVLEAAARQNIQDPGEFWYALGMCRYALWEETWDDFIDEDGDGIDDRLEEVVGAYRRGLTFPEMAAAPKIFYATGQAYENYGSFEGAMQMYSHIISGFPTYTHLPQVILKAAALCRHPRINQIDQATQYFEYLLDNPPPPYDSNRLAFILAGCYQRQGKKRLAKDMFHDVLKKEYEQQRHLRAKKLKESSGTNPLLSGLNKPTTTRSAKIPNIQTWMSDPNMWRERAQFHFKAGIFTLAVDAMSQTLRVANTNQQHQMSTTPEWEDWELLAISLGRINEKESALKALEKAFNLNPYAEPVRLRQRIARWDPIDWGVRILNQEKTATKITAFFRGRMGARQGKVSMHEEKIKRATRNHAAKTIQYAYRYQLFRRNLKRQRELIARSLGRIAKRVLQFTWDSWDEFLHLVQYHRARRNRNQTSIKLWFLYEKHRDIRKRRRAHNRNVVAKALELMRTKIKRAIVKAWEGYVVWIIDVKEPYNATTIQCWYKHIHWRKEFFRKRGLILNSLNNIRLNFARRLFHHMRQVCLYQKYVRISRTVLRPKDRYKKCFDAWKYRTLEFRPWWIEAKEERIKERFYTVRRTAFRLVDSNSLRTDPRNPFSVLGLASVGVAQAGGSEHQLIDTTSTEAKLQRMNRHPSIVKQLRRSFTMYEKVCRLWREFYANREESQGVSFMHSRLPKDSFDRAHLGSIYYKGIVQTALIKQELDRFRLTKIPLDKLLRSVMPGPRNRKPKTTLGTLLDKEKEQMESHFVQIHRQLLMETSQKFVKPQSLSAMALTLPNALRKQVKNFEPPGKMWSKKMNRLTGKNVFISKFNLVPPTEEDDHIYVDRAEEDLSSDEEQGDGVTDEFGNDDPQAILNKIIADMGSNFQSMLGPAAMTNRHAWGFPEYVRPGVYGVEGTEKAKNEADYDKRIAKGEWARMAREEIEQRETDAILLRKAREDDYNRFAKASNVCGPMSEMDFFCALRPGRLYEQRAYVSACRIQLWSLIWVPRRYSNRLEASLHIQRIGRGFLAKKLLTTLLKIKRNVHKMKMRARDSSFRTWWTQWNNKRLAQRMMARLFNKELGLRWDRWCKYIEMIQEERLQVLAKVYKKMANAKLSRHFVIWAEYVPHAKKIRRLMWKVMASHKFYLFDTWANNVEDIVEDRKEMSASIAIQRVYRGRLGRQYASQRKKALSTIAYLLQRVVRGHIGRVRCKLVRKRKRDAQIRQAREDRIRQLRGSYNDRIKAEKNRRYMEQMFVEDAARTAEMTTDMKKNKVWRKNHRKKIKTLAKDIQLFGKNNSTLLERFAHGSGAGSGAGDQRAEMVGILPIPIKYMTWPLLKNAKRRVVAERWVRSVNRSTAAMFSMTTFRATRPPPFSCLKCMETFVEERDLEHHVLCHVDQAHWLYTPEAYYEFGLAESGGSVVGKRTPRERRMSSYIK